MDHVTVSVDQVQGGWSVVSSLTAGSLMFLSAARAEVQACGLAVLAVRLGADAEVQMHDRLGGLISVATYEAIRTAGLAEPSSWRSADRAKDSTTPPAAR